MPSARFGSSMRQSDILPRYCIFSNKYRFWISSPCGLGVVKKITNYEVHNLTRGVYEKANTAAGSLA